MSCNWAYFSSNESNRSTILQRYSPIGGWSTVAIARLAFRASCSNNNNQSNWAKSGIAVTSQPNSSFAFATWEQQFVIACFGWGSTPKSPLSLRVSDPSNTMCRWTHKCICQMACQSAKRHECDRQTTDRPRYGEMSRTRWNSLLCKSDFAQ